MTSNIWLALLHVNRVICNERPAHISIFSTVSLRRPLTCVWKHTVQSANSIQAPTNYLSKAPSAFPYKTLPHHNPPRNVSHIQGSNHPLPQRPPIPSGMKTFSKKGRYEKCVKCVFSNITIYIKLYCDKFVGAGAFTISARMYIVKSDKLRFIYKMWGWYNDCSR